jgi:carbon-monoxide dehydrogenase large subunit
MLHAAVLRSPVPHARIHAIDVEKARVLDGVCAVLTGADLPPDFGVQPCNHMLHGQRATPYYALARDRVRYTGEPVAIVAAESRYVAEDALELIEVDYEPLPSVGSAIAALEPGTAQLWDEWPDNVAGTFEKEIGDVEAAFAAADVVVTETFDIQRLFACSLETRGVLAEWSADRDELTLWTSTQVPHTVRDFLAELLCLPENRVRVRVPRVGGGFGAKFHFYPEEVAVALVARAAGRPVRWVEDRLESFVATVHAREQHVTATIAATSEGAITAIAADIVADMGAALHTVSYGPAWLTSTLIGNVYEIPNIRARMRAVVTNKTPLGSYRGWGQPQANFIAERMVERLADALGEDSVVLRRRNFIPVEHFPYTGLHHTFDNGDYAACLDQALAFAGYDVWRERQRALRADGRHIGIGVSFYVENSALGPSRKLNAGGVQLGGYDIAHVRIEASGTVSIFTGLCEIGQGFTNGLAQLCADELGVRPHDVHVVSGDTDSCPYTGYGTGGSRSAAVGGAAITKAARRLREKVTAIAAHMFEIAPEDIEIADGRLWPRGVPTRQITFADVGRAAYLRAIDLPEGLEPGLEVIETFDPPEMAWPYGANVVVVEVDVATGEVSFLDYAYVHDCGTILNPLIVEGQIHGGVAQGIGMALYEQLRYDEDGNPLFGSFMDYILPTAREVPRMRLAHQETPSPNIPGGMKGVGEAGTIGSPAAVANAVEDALRPFGAKITTLPITPQRVYELVVGASVLAGRATP